MRWGRWTWIALTWVAGCGGGTFHAPLHSGRGAWLQTGGALGTAALAEGPQPPLQILWSRRVKAPPMGGGLLAGPLLLQVTKGQKIFAFDLASGEQVGRRGSQEPVCGVGAIAGAEAQWLVLGEAGKKPRLRGYDRRTRKPGWEVEARICRPVSSRGDTLLAVSGDQRLLALSSVDGRQLWSASLATHPTTGAVFHDVVALVGGARGQMTGVRLDSGQILWQRRLGDGRAAVRGQPLAAAGHVFAATADGRVWCLSAADGTVLWSTPITGLPAAGFSLRDGILVVGSSDRRVYGLSASDGRQLWRFETGGLIRGAPAAAAGVVYVGSGDGSLYALALRTGEKVWSYELDGPILTPVVLARDLLSVTTETGTVYLLAAAAALGG